LHHPEQVGTLLARAVQLAASQLGTYELEQGFLILSNLVVKIGGAEEK